MAEQMSERLFSDHSLVEKHKLYLNKLKWGNTLGKRTSFVPALPCLLHPGIHNDDWIPDMSHFSLKYVLSSTYLCMDFLVLTCIYL